MRKNILTYITILLGSVILFNACKKNKDTNDNSTIPSGYKMNASQSVENTAYTIELYTKTTGFYVGYNNIYIAIKNITTNEYVDNAGIIIRPYMPQMPMMGMKMPCNDATNQIAKNNLFACGADFTMASNADDPMIGLWNLEVKAKLPNMADSIKAICAFNVPDTRKPTNEISTNASETFANTLKLGTSTYRVNLVAPRSLIDGSQPIGMRIFKKIGTLSTGYWESVIDNNLKIIGIKPWMPDPAMMHGSSNNVDPILNTSIGAYQGTINFTMTGLWDITYTLTDGTNTVIGTFTIIL